MSRDLRYLIFSVAITVMLVVGIQFFARSRKNLFKTFSLKNWRPNNPRNLYVPMVSYEEEKLLWYHGNNEKK